MKVLIACEFSGHVRNAFARRGHYSVSVDLLPTENKNGWHCQADIFDVLNDGWDLMIAHPPCTYLSAAGLHFCIGNKERQIKRDLALQFVSDLFLAPINKIAIENPVGYLSTAWRKPDQVVRMNWFGEDAIKPTCLWLKGLPELKKTNEIKATLATSGKRQSKWYQDNKTPRARSITMIGFANAMADQWG